jgi:hypothetical protein
MYVSANRIEGYLFLRISCERQIRYSGLERRGTCVLQLSIVCLVSKIARLLGVYVSLPPRACGASAQRRETVRSRRSLVDLMTSKALAAGQH